MNDLDDLEWLFHVKLGFRTSSFSIDSEGSTLKHNYVKTNERRPILYQRQKCRPITVVSGNINHL